MEKIYAQALFNLSQKQGVSDKDIVSTLISHLKEVGRIKLLPRILRELRRLDAQSLSLDETFEVASEAEKSFASKEASELGITIQATINEQLVTGWRARKGSRVIDRSGKRALIDLYRAIAAHA